jgi:hypothetical protein
MKFWRDIFNPLRILRWSVGILFFGLAGLLIYLMTGQATPASQITFGVSFSQPFAEEMGLDWQNTYLAILDELGVKKIRLIAYWPRIEPEPGKYTFDDLDWQISEAEQRGAEVILAIGRRLPRWPECHIPDWAKDLSESEQQERVLQMLVEVVNHYRGNKTIKAWQVENEPFLRGFGHCPKLDKKFLDKEISLVRKLDGYQRPIILTASGELSSWLQPAMRADILGTSLYRIIWNKYLGYFHYPIRPVFYYKRANLVKRLTGIEKIILIELQAEPWGPKLIEKMSSIEQARSMDLKKLKEIINYARQTGFDEIYLWGAEWWHWTKREGNSAIWEEVKKLWVNEP